MKPNQNQYQSWSLEEIPILRLHYQPGWSIIIIIDIYIYILCIIMYNI